MTVTLTNKQYEAMRRMKDNHNKLVEEIKQLKEEIKLAGGQEVQLVQKLEAIQSWVLNWTGDCPDVLLDIIDGKEVLGE